jgi:hypothetical protein
MLRGITPERDQQIKGKINKRKRWLGFSWFLLLLAAGIVIAIGPGGTNKRDSIKYALAIVYTGNANKEKVTGILVKKGREKGYVLTVAGEGILAEQKGTTIQVWFPYKTGMKSGTLLEVESVKGFNNPQLSPSIALIEVELPRGTKNQPVSLYNGAFSQLGGQEAELWQIDFDTGKVIMPSTGPIQYLPNLLLVQFNKEHKDGAPIVLKRSGELIGIFPEKLSKPSEVSSGEISNQFGEVISVYEIKQLIDQIWEE